MNNIMNCARPLCTVLLEWNAGMEYWNGLNCYKYLIQYRTDARLQSHGLDSCADCLLSRGHKFQVRSRYDYAK